MIDNEWGFSGYPVVGGHEVIGSVVALGANAKGRKRGQKVGLGWMAQSCQTCNPCLSGEPQMCRAGVPTIVGHHGGFAERVRAHWLWVAPIPEGVNPADAGPLLCGGLTVFSPFLNFDIKPTHRVGVVGIGGRGHPALKFARARGGVRPAPLEVESFALIGGQRSVSGSPTGSRQDIDTMLEFAARHGIAPQTEHFPMSRLNDALDHLRDRKARYRVVLDADFEQA